MSIALLLIALAQSASDLLAAGQYTAAIERARSAFEAHERAGQHAEAAWDLNDIGLANQYLGRYDAALDAYSQALDLDRKATNGDGEITRLNNIGNVYFFLARYSDADAFYQDAWRGVDTKASLTERGRLRKMTLSNMAVLAQRLGADERALDLYERVAAAGSMQPAEEAQLLVNRGAMVRRLGDPTRALELYERAQALFARAAHSDGEIGAWRNIGIARALDLHDEAGALSAFDAGLRLAYASKNRLRVVQALLYRAEALRRAGRPQAASTDLQEALDQAVAGKMIEEQWKALYEIGLLRRDAADMAGARAAFERAIDIFESVRADLRTIALRAEFLADKRDVYDALIWLRANERPVDPVALFRIVERSRARVWQDRLAPRAPAMTLGDVQPRLAADAALLEFSSSSDGVVSMIVTRTGARVDVVPWTDRFRAAIDALPSRIAARSDNWREASIVAGSVLLHALLDDAGIRRLLVSADGPLQFVPFETLTLPGGDTLLVQRFVVGYVPSAAWLLRSRPAVRRWAWPWQPELAAFADPAADTYPLEPSAPARLPYAVDEVHRVAAALGGKAEIHIGGDATKARVSTAFARRVPVLHFATHAVADTRDPERSRILLAPPRRDAAADYFFLADVHRLDLAGVSLVALSACETERGRVVRGEGVEGFSRAVLAAGAASTVTTLWSVADRPAAELMARFYASVGRHAALGDALREAKLQFIASGGAWTHPYYWAGYLLSGDSSETLPRVLPWTAVACGALLLAAMIVTAAIRAARRAEPRPFPR